MGKGKKRRKKRKKTSLFGKIGIFVLVFLSVLLLLALLLLGGYFFMNRQGRSRLAKKQEAVPQKMSTVSEEQEEGTSLKAGELRYQGKTYAYKQDILTFLFMGIDKKGEVKASGNLFKGGQADALFLAVLDPSDKKISIVGINRDTMTEISVFDRNGLYAGRQVQQIALAHAYGEGLEESCENTVEAVSRLFFGLPVHGYCALNMSVIPAVNDAVGGVDVIIPESAAGLAGSWKTGDAVHLTGEDAYTFIHHRDTKQAQSAEARLERQKQYLKAFVAQAREAMKKDMTLPVTLYTQMTPYMVTDISADEVVYLAGEALSYRFDEGDIYSMEGYVEMGEQFEEFHADDTALYELVLQVFYDEVPAS